MPRSGAGSGSAPASGERGHAAGGPFTVTVPIAARYEELAKAMSLAFTDGKLFFSKEFPALYMEKPEVYAAKDQVVLKLHIAGPRRQIRSSTRTSTATSSSAGTRSVEDNELRIPDLEPTVETKNLLLKLKAALDGDSIRDEARAALRLDIGDAASVGARQALHGPRVRQRARVPSGRRRQDRGDRRPRPRLVPAALRGDDRARLGLHALSAIALLRSLHAGRHLRSPTHPRPPRTLWANAYLAPGSQRVARAASRRADSRAAERATRFGRAW